MPYESDEAPGEILFSSNGSTLAAPVRIAPRLAAGHYEIRLGLFFGHGPSMFWTANSHFGGSLARTLMRVRLERDAAWDVVSDEIYGPKSGRLGDVRQPGFGDVLEVLWKEADLAPDDALLLGNLDHEAFEGTIASLAHVRFVPVEKDALGPVRKSVANFDSTFWGGYPRNEEEVRSMMEPFRGGDFHAIHWEMVKGDECYYPTAIGRHPTAFADPLYYPNLIPRDLGMLMEQGDPLEIGPRIAHEMGIQFFAALRLMLTRVPFGFFVWPDSGGFGLSQRQYWTVDEKGGSHPHLSLAFEQVRTHLLGYCEEMLQRDGVDGISMLFNRSYPFVLFEQPVCDAFHAAGGGDAREAAASDERLLQVRCGFVTEYMRSLRALAETAGARRRSVSVTVMGSPWRSRYFGLDVQRWIEEGLIDELIVHPCFSAESEEGSAVTPDDIRQWKDLVRGRGVVLRVDLYPRHLPPSQIVEKSCEYLEAGADGLALWDTYSRMCRKSEWSVLRRAGDSDRLQRWRKEPGKFRRIVPLRSIMGMSLDHRFGIQTHG